MSYPVRYNTIKEQWEVEVGQVRWRKAVLQECWNCSSKFYRPAAESNRTRGNGRYCSYECAMVKVAPTRDKKVLKPCAICFDFFKVKKSHFNRYSTCAKPECRTELRRRNTLKRHGKLQ